METKQQKQIDDELVELFNYYSSYEDLPASRLGKDDLLFFIQDRCNAYFSRDHVVHLIQNRNYCESYPPQFIFTGSLNFDDAKEHEKNNGENLSLQLKHEQNARKLEKGMEISKNCRVHQRFPVPVILFGKKNICRSASLSEAAEIFYRSKTQNIDRNSSRTQHRKIDVKWLKILKVKHIVDLMVKDKFQVLGIALYQSEKSNEQHRTTFKVTGLPFPGVESFEDFIERVDKLNGKPMTTQFWERIPAQITLSMPYQLPRPNEWSAYRSWNIVQLTQNYIRYIMHLLHDPDEEAGLSLHCISGLDLVRRETNREFNIIGWDRTPLYISLLRILLWAEGLVHQSLDVDQMLYLTVAYDWLLFGHNLVNRLNKGRQIFYFCFWVLEHLKDDDYSYGYELQLKNMTWEAGTYTGVAPYEVPSTPAIDGGNTNSNNNQQEESNSTSSRSPRAVLGELNSPERRRERKRRLEAIRAKFMRLYNVHIHPRFKDRKNIVKILLNMLPQ